MKPLTQTIHDLERYQTWRRGEDERTFDESGLTAKGIGETIDNALLVLCRLHKFQHKTNSEIRLICGEMTTDDLRLVRSVIAHVVGDPIQFFKEIN